MTIARKRSLVSAWMTEHLISVGSDDPLFAAVEKMAERAIRHVLVTEGERLLGILSNRDLVRASYANPEHRIDLHGVTVGAVMTPHPITVTKESSVCEAAQLMVEHAINALPVVTEPSGAPIGILTSDDLLRALSLQDLMPPSPQV